MVTMLPVEYFGRSVVIDGERFPCSGVEGDHGAGVFFSIPLESGLVAEFCNCPETEDPHPELWLYWVMDPAIAAVDPERESMKGVMEEDGRLVCQSPSSACGIIARPESGAEIRALLIRWSQMEVVESAQLKQDRLALAASA